MLLCKLFSSLKVYCYSLQLTSCDSWVWVSECEVAQSCPTLCDPMDCSLPGSSVHGIFQARVLEWVAISFSRGSSQPRDWTRVSRFAGRRFTVWATGKPSVIHTFPFDNCFLFVWTLSHSLTSSQWDITALLNMSFTCSETLSGYPLLTCLIPDSQTWCIWVHSVV